MHIADWKENFISKMITRGRNYWRAGAVKNLHCTQEKITADVEGTRLYRVEITLAGDAVATLSCTCPFAKEGANCKHMAAVLFAATHLPEAELPAPEWEKKLNSLSAETLRDFLRPLLKKDEALRNRLMLCKGNAPVRADERRLNWQRTLTQTLHAAERYSENEYDEYAEYDEEEESPVQELLELLDAELADLLTPEHAMLAFELVCDTAMMFESADEILEQEDIEDACRRCMDADSCHRSTRPAVGNVRMVRRCIPDVEAAAVFHRAAGVLVFVFVGRSDSSAESCAARRENCRVEAECAGTRWRRDGESAESA